MQYCGKKPVYKTAPLCDVIGTHAARAFPVPKAVDFLGGCLGADADQVVAVQAVIHIDAVAVEIEVRGSELVYSQLFVQT